MVRTATLIPLVLLAGCSDPPRPRTESEIRELARNAVQYETSRLEARINQLETELIDLRATDAIHAKAIESGVNYTLDVSRQVNNNARIANENALREMTAKGACGKDWWQDSNGVWNYRNKECTRKDFSKD